MATRDELRAAGRLTGDVLAGGVGLLADVQRAIAHRAFGGRRAHRATDATLDAAPTTAAATHHTYHAITDAVYGAARGVVSVVPRLVASGAALAKGDAPAWTDRPRGRAVISALNGIWGDTIDRRYPELSPGMAVRVGHRDVDIVPGALAAAFPDATPRICVFVHGLCETDESWLRQPKGTTVPLAAYGPRLHDDLGYTPVYLRYNSGLRVSDNGTAFADLLEELVAGWPVAVEEVVLVGHSMGGLVARSACRAGELAGRHWVGHVHHVFCLGTPHLGAPLEKGVNVASSVLGLLPETRPLATQLNHRSAGVKDLRYGAIVEEDWRDIDPDEFLRDRCTEVPFLPDAAYYFVGATLTVDARHPVAALVGDLLVRLPSAAGVGRRRRVPFELDRGVHLGGLSHFDLLNHPAVYEQLRDWLAAAAADRSDDDPPPTRGRSLRWVRGNDGADS